jgi:hypothetical protein
MRFEGEGDTSIHASQLRATASLLHSGAAVDEVVDQVLETTRRAMASEPRAAAWNWEEEEHGIRGMCFAFVSKNPDLAYTLPDDLRGTFEERLEADADPLICFRRGAGWRVRSRKPGSSPNYERNGRIASVMATPSRRIHLSQAYPSSGQYHLYLSIRPTYLRGSGCIAGITSEASLLPPLGQAEAASPRSISSNL